MPPLPPLIKDLLPFGMMGLSALFGGGDEQERKSFAPKKGVGGATDPRTALYNALAGTFRLGQGLTQRGPARLRSSVVQPGPAPVSIPGIPFQIGGGLGLDPALRDPSLLDNTYRGDPFKFDPFQGQEKMLQPVGSTDPRISQFVNKVTNVSPFGLPTRQRKPK